MKTKPFMQAIAIIVVVIGIFMLGHFVGQQNARVVTEYVYLHDSPIVIQVDTAKKTLLRHKIRTCTERIKW